MRRMRRLLIPLTLALTAGAWAQKPTFEGLVEVSEVLIDVLATDALGEVVLGLGKDDFVVEEDGEEVELVSVSYYTTRYDDRGAAPGEVPSSRYFVLFFHDPTRVGGFDPRDLRQLIRAGRESQRFVEEEMQGSDWVAVVSYDSRLKVHQDFTQDKDSLLFAIEGVLAHRDPAKDAPPRRTVTGAVPSLLRHLPRGHELRRETRDVYDALRRVASASGFIVGRKNLLLFTFGMGGERTEGERRFDRLHYDPMTTALNDHNVAVYPIHLGGRGVGQPGSVFLERLADDTGGVYYENVARFFEPLETIGDESYGYYVLSYQSLHPAGEVGYERISVRARDETIQVRARRGYRYGL